MLPGRNVFCLAVLQENKTVESQSHAGMSYLHKFQLDILRILEARLVSCMVLPSTSEFPALEFLVYPISLMLRCPRELSCTGESSPAYDGYMVVIRFELE